MLFSLLKATCLAIYALAILGLAGILPSGPADTLQTIAALLLIAHVLELPFAFRHLRTYSGPLATSVLLTLLFGLFHWKPLADRRAREQAGE